MSIKYLSSSGLTEVWSNIKAYIASKIPSKIITSLSINGKTITYTNSDGTTGTLTTQDTNTDTKVTQTVTTTNAEYPVLFSTDANKTATSTTTARFSSNIKINPSTNTITATTFKGNLSGTATKAVQDASGNIIVDTYATKSELTTKANDDNVVHKSGTETIVGTKTFSSQIKGSVSGTSSNVVVGSDTATTRGYLVNGKLPWYKWENGSQVIAGSVPLITDFNNLTKPGVYHVVFCLNDGFVHQENEYKETLNRPSIPGSTKGFMDAILEIKQTTTMHTISSANRLVQKLTLLSGSSKKIHTDLTYHRVCIMYSPINEWTAWKTVARDEEVVHKSGDETIGGAKTFSGVRTKFYKSLDLYHDEDYKLNTNPSVKTYQYVFFTGKSGWYSAYLENRVDIDGASYCNLLTRNTNEQSATVQLAIDSKNVKTFKPNSNNNISLGTSANKWSEVWANTFKGKLDGNAATATKATNNASGNELSNSIIKGLSVSGKVITYTKLDGSTGTITTQDTNTTYASMKGATAKAAGTAGLVPAPAAGKQGQYLRGDGTWQTPTNNNVTNTLSTTTKAYVTGTTKATTNTGTQVFDTGVYLDTTAGQLVATTFKGNLSGNASTATKATQDASGNVITNTYATKTELNTKANNSSVVHRSGNETIDGLKTFNYWQIINMGLNVKWITGNKEQKSLHLFGSMDDKYVGYGSVLELHGEDEKYGMFTLIAKDKTNTNVKRFTGLPNGSLTWEGKHIVRTVNGIGANQEGNVNLTNILGFTPVQQGGGTGQLGNKIYIGWTGSQLKCTVDKTDLGAFVFEGRSQIGTTITAYWGSSSSTGNRWERVSGLNGTERVSSTSDTFIPVVGQIYSGNQLYSTAKPNGGVGDTDVQDHAPEAVYARLNLSGAFNSSYKYLCTTAVGVNATASVYVTGHTAYTSSGPYTTITGYKDFIQTVQGGKSTFLRVQ